MIQYTTLPFFLILQNTSKYKGLRSYINLWKSIVRKSINSCLYASIVSKTSCICGFALLLLYWVYSNIKLYWFQCVFALSTRSALLGENYFKSVKYYRPFVLCYNIYNHFKLKNPCICIITNAWITFILASENNKVLFRFIHNRFFYFLLLILSLLLKLT